MMNVSEYIRNDLLHKITLAHCSFALPYADSPLELLTDLSLQLNATLGRIAVSLPVSPHEMVQYCAETHEIPQSVLNSISFGESKVISHMRNLFGEVDVHYFNNELIFLNLVDFKTIYSNSTYFDEPNAEKHWQMLKDKCPRAKRVNKVKGQTEAYHAAANLSDTEWFYAVFAKHEPIESFHYDWQPDRLKSPKKVESDL